MTYFETLKEISENKTHTVIMPSKMIFLNGKKSAAPGNDPNEEEDVSENPGD